MANEEMVVLSTKEQLEEFKNSLVWKDITNELEAWSEGFRREQDSMVDELANNPVMSTAHLLTHMGDLHGRRQAVLYFMSLPDILIEQLSQQKEEVSNE